MKTPTKKESCPPQTAPKGSALWTPAPAQRAPLAGEAAYAAGTEGSALWTPAIFSRKN